MPYYKHTMQHKALKLMASKLAAAGMIEGNFSEEGLSAMSEIQDMTTQMAKELMLGIQDSVEDLAASFKKMAILHTEETDAEITSPVEAPKPTAIAIQTTQQRRRKNKVDENQLSLFDLVA